MIEGERDKDDELFLLLPRPLPDRVPSRGDMWRKCMELTFEVTRIVGDDDVDVADEDC